MNRYFDNWERLVTATLRREELRQLARAHSRDPSLDSISSDFSFTSTLHDQFRDPQANPTLLQLLSAPFSSSIPLPTPRPRPEDSVVQLLDARPVSFNELKYATRNFHPGNILGEGRFGPIFNGTIKTLTSGSGMAVAVMKCNGMPGFKEWLKDMNYLSRLHHPNVIELLAYCEEGDNLLLVYESASEGSLFNHLFRGLRRHPSWDTRIKVAIGAARGLSFLHDENKVIHKNFSSSNILLDKEFNVKLSNFGYAEEARNSYETPMGEIYCPYEYIGYASPEYRDSGYWSEKCEVYAFGVVLLELLCGRQAIHENRSLVDWMKPYLSNKKGVHAVMDPKLEIKYLRKGVLGFANLADQCVSKNPQNRPCMTNVLAELERLKYLS